MSKKRNKKQDKKPDFLADLNADILDDLTEKGRISNAAGLAGELTELEEVTDMEDGGLSEKQRLFCLYYVKYRNKTKAYQKAYQCSYENANAHAYEVWENVGVQAEIKKLLKEVHEDIKIDIKDLLRQQIDIARADITDFVDIQKGFVTMREDMDGTLIREIKNTQSGIAIKLYDKQKAIDWLAKNMDTTGSGAAEDGKLLADVLLGNRGNRSIEDFEEGD